jgi:hypothetical protein
LLNLRKSAAEALISFSQPQDAYEKRGIIRGIDLVVNSLESLNHFKPEVSNAGERRVEQSGRPEQFSTDEHGRAKAARSAEEYRSPY